jgi:hypothetical protein
MPPIPLLAGELTQTQQLSLAALSNQPGYAVLELLFTESIKRAQEDITRINPEVEGYERKLKAAHQKLRERTEFAFLILHTVQWQTQPAFVTPEPEKIEVPEVNRIVKPLVKRTE